MAKIMIVDDFSAIRELLMEELAAEGHIVTGVGELKSVRDMISMLEPDLLIMDIYMHRKVSWTPLEEIKKQNPHLPVLIFTGFGGNGDPRLSLADEYVLKNSDLDELKNKVGEILRNNYRPGGKQEPSLSV